MRIQIIDDKRPDAVFYYTWLSESYPQHEFSFTLESSDIDLSADAYIIDYQHLQETGDAIADRILEQNPGTPLAIYSGHSMSQLKELLPEKYHGLCVSKGERFEATCAQIMRILES